ncbi:MAG: hypothetical protein ACMG55_19570, partial [Microcoleus sp.]
MGEEESHNPDQQGEQPRYDLEQKPEQDGVVQSNAEGEQAAEVAEPSSVDQNDDPETRWDHDKAETMAAVLKDDGEFDAHINQRERDKDFYTSEEYIDDSTKDKRDMKEFIERGDESTNAQLKKFRGDYENAVDAAHLNGQRIIEKSRERV